MMAGQYGPVRSSKRVLRSAQRCAAGTAGCRPGRGRCTRRSRNAGGGRLGQRCSRTSSSRFASSSSDDRFAKEGISGANAHGQPELDSWTRFGALDTATPEPDKSLP